MDTMTGTKIVGGFCGALLILLLDGWVAETIYHVGDSHGSHDKEGHHQAYIIDTGDGDHGETEEEEEVPFAELLAAADPGAGERVFKKCSSCHKLEDGANGTGPHLHNVVGRDVASVAGFGYKGDFPDPAWTPEALNGFLENPKAYASGTTMNFKGLPKPQDRANLIAYLGSMN